MTIQAQNYEKVFNYTNKMVKKCKKIAYLRIFEFGTVLADGVVNPIKSWRYKMKKLLILAMSVMMVANMSAQEAKAEKAECQKNKKECKMTKEQRIEMDIKFLTDELYLSDEQAAKFAVTYREFIAAKEKLNKEFAAKFGKDLNERQVARVLHFHGPKPQGPKHKGPRPEFKDGKGPRPEGKPCPKKD